MDLDTVPDHMVSCISHPKKVSPSTNSGSSGGGGGLEQTASAIRAFFSRDLMNSTYQFIAMPPASSKEDSSLDAEQESVLQPLRQEVESIDLGTTCSELSVFGNPLKLQEIADLSNIGGRHLLTSTPIGRKQFEFTDVPGPVHISEARKLISIQSSMTEEGISSRKFGNKVCIAQNPNSLSKSLILIGVFDMNDDSNELEKTQRPKIKTVKTVMKTDDNAKVKLPREKVTAPSNGSSRLTVTYQILDEKDGLGNILLTKQDNVYSLQVTVGLGCEHSPMYGLFCDLQKVGLLLKWLTRKDTQTDAPSAMEETQSFLECIKNGGSYKSSREVRGTLSSSLRTLSMDQRQNMDFTEQLWDILGGKAEICKSLNTVFSAMKRGNCDVFVHKDNTTTVAQLVRQSYTGIACFPSLTDLLALRLVGEMGLDKAVRDYKYLLLKNDLCSGEQWEAFFASQDSNSSNVKSSADMEDVYQRSILDKFNALVKIHHCLEIVSVIDSYIDGLDLGRIMETLMSYYKTQPMDEHNVFTFPMTAAQAVPKINKRSIHSLKREITMAGGKVKVENYLSDLPPPLNVIVDISTDPADVSAVMGENPSYFYVETQEQLIEL